MADVAPRDRKPFWAKCPCGHTWPVCYLPMEAARAAKLMQRAQCPMCGEKKGLTVAKQADGVLLEEVA